MSYEYRARSDQQWNRRTSQNRFSNYGASREPVPDAATAAVEDPELENDDQESPTGKVSTTTPCAECGHVRKNHHLVPEPHTADGEHDYYCITQHCAVYALKDGKSEPCTCLHFRAALTDPVKLTRPRVGPYDRCGNCGHWKSLHCTKAKPGKVNRLKAGESAYKILIKPDGVAYGCKHFSDDPKCQCTSTSCSAAVGDGNEHCSCEAFANPWLTPKTKKPAKPRQPRAPRKKKTAQVNGELLFPPPPPSDGPVLDLAENP